MSDPLSIVASLVAVLQLSTQVITYLKSVKYGSSDRVRLRDELRNAIYLLEMLQDRAEEATDEELRNGPLSTLAGLDGPLKSYQHTLEDLVAKLVPRDATQRRLQSLRWPFEKKEVERMLVSLERQKSHFSLVIQHNVVGLAKITHQKVDVLGDAVSDLRMSQDRVAEHMAFSEKQKVLQWISPLVFEARQVDILQRVQAGTGEWLLRDENFQKWCSSGGGDGSQTVWCPGIPGAGKTFVAATVVHYLQQQFRSPDVAVNFIYCDFQARAEQTIPNLVASVLRQLLDRRESLPQELISLYEDHKANQTSPSSSQNVAMLRGLAGQYQSYFIILDALDELVEIDRADLLSTLCSISSNIRLFCTSRPLTGIARLFEDSTQIEISARVEDVRLFLESQITKPGRLNGHVRADPSLGAEIVDTIAMKVEGMFLLAALHIESLTSKLSRKDVRKQLQRLPQTLDGTYAQSLARIRSQSEDDVRLAERVLSWIVCSERPLGVRELQQMYATWSLEPEENLLEDDALPEGDLLTSVCGGLVVIDAQLQKARLVHYTAQDYFERNHTNMLEAARSEITRLCLRYVGLENFLQGACNDDIQMDQRLQDYPFIEYASRYWGAFIHLINLDEHWEQFRSFLENRNTLHVATQAGSLPTYRFTGWSQRYPSNVPSLVLAASFGGAKSLLLKLLHIFPDLEERGSDGQTALIRSAAHGHLSNTIVLKEAGGKTDAVDSSLQTALIHAAANGHDDVVEYLIMQDRSNISQRDQDDWTALMAGASNGSVKVTWALVQAGADVNMESLDGDTALSLAAKGGFRDVFDLLLQSQARLPVNSASRRAMRVATTQGIVASTVDSDIWQTDTSSRGNILEPVQRLGTLLKRHLKSTNTNAYDWVGDLDFLPTLTLNVNNDNDHVYTLQEFISDFHPASSFRNRYQKKEFFKDTATASFHSCSDRVTGALYVVKVYDILEPSPKYPVTAKLNMISRQVRLLGDLHHANILGVHDLIAEIEYVYLVYNVGPHTDLFNYIVSMKKLSEQDSRKIYKQLCSAVRYLHERRIMHREVTPENIVVTDSRLSIVLVNFGGAKVLNPGEFETDLMGRPSYVAPEIMARNRRYSLPVDVWSMGVLLYICLCGFPPFSDELYSAENPYTLAQQISMGRFDYPSPYWDPIPDSALDLIDRMLTVDPLQRCTVQQCQEHEWMTHGDGAESVVQ